MDLMHSQTSFKYTNIPDSPLRRGCKSRLSKEALTPAAGREDDYGESDSSLQSYNCAMGSSALCSCSLQTANELLCHSLKDFRTERNQISQVEGGVYAFQAGRETRVNVSIRDDVCMVQVSAVVHGAKVSEVSCSKTRRGRGHLLLMTMMRLNSRLSRSSCGGRICACDGQFLFFQDFPISILDGSDILQRKLDEFVMKTVAISRCFDRTPSDDVHSKLRHRQAPPRYMRVITQTNH